MRTFSTGATRNSDANKPDFEGFFSPLVLGYYAQYMHKNRVQADGKLRDSDNWQKGFGLKTLFSSLWRHFWQSWMLYRGNKVYDWDNREPIHLKEALCGLLFNTQAALHEILVAEIKAQGYADAGEEKPTVPARGCCDHLCGYCDYIGRPPADDHHEVARMEGEGGPAN